MIKSMGKSMAITAAVLLMLAATARASPIANPDLTITDLVVTYNAPNLDVVSDSGGSVLSWTLPDGSLGGLTLGTASLTWDGSTGTFLVIDTLNALTLMGGSVQGITVAPAVFYADVLLGISALAGFGDHVTVKINSTDFSNVRIGSGTGNADVLAVPEPATMALFLLGGGAVAWRKRRRSMTPTQS